MQAGWIFQKMVSKHARLLWSWKNTEKGNYEEAENVFTVLSIDWVISVTS